MDNLRWVIKLVFIAKIFSAPLRNCIEPKIEKILRKNQNGFQRNQSPTSQILTIRQIPEGACAKNLEATILFVVHRGKTEQILLAYGLPKETVTAIMMLYKNTKVKVHFLDGDTDYFNTLAPYLFIICLDYVLRTSIDIMKVNSFKPAKERSRRYPAQTITDMDYADDKALRANKPTQAETLLHRLEWAVVGIGVHVNVDKIEYMCFNQRGNTSILNGSSLKLVDKFTYLESSVSSTKKNVNTRLLKAWTAISHMEVRPDQ